MPDKACSICPLSCQKAFFAPEISADVVNCNVKAPTLVFTVGTWRGFSQSGYVYTESVGERFQVYGQNGSKIYMEQTSHHPPQAHFLIEGPDDQYKQNDWLEFDVK